MSSIIISFFSQHRGSIYKEHSSNLPKSVKILNRRLNSLESRTGSFLATGNVSFARLRVTWGQFERFVMFIIMFVAFVSSTG